MGIIKRVDCRAKIKGTRLKSKQKCTTEVMNTYVGQYILRAI